MNLKTEVLIIGGGATGAGIARDLSLRGIPSLLIEKGDFLSGASGRNHGLLHSGGRYVVSDPEAARECIAENRILRKIAPHCIEETDGLFVSLPEDGLDFRDRFIQACEVTTLPAHLLSRDEALSLEPGLNPDLLSAVKVPDGAIDPFELVLANAKDAETRGARCLLHTEIASLLVDGDRVKTVLAKDLLHGEEYLIEAAYIINATGAWADELLKLAGLRIAMALSKGSMLITNQRLTHRVVNRCRPPSDGDIVVPNHTVSILGTTSIPLEDADNFEVTPREVSLLIRETSRMLPAIEETRFIRAYAGIRPLFQSGEKGDDRTISRGFVLIDHEKRDGIRNLITITGGKLVTYRLMAEKTADLLCRKMGIDISCTTHLNPLPGAEKPSDLKDRLKTLGKVETLCDCELVRREEVEEVLREGKLKNLQDILHRTRLAKGTCQGGFCVYRLLGILNELGLAEENPNKILKGFLEERWKGIRPVLWGTSVKEEELIEGIYKGILNITPTLPSPSRGRVREGGKVVMHYDLIIIGMGLSGLMAAKTAAEAGRKVLIIGKGMGCLTLFSNTIDVLGKVPETTRSRDGLSQWIQDHPEHPYSKVGLTGIEEGLSSFTSLFHPPYSFQTIGDGNCFIPTGAGTMRPTYLIPVTMVAGASGKEKKGLIVGFKGFRDFYAGYVAGPLNWRGITLPLPETPGQEISATALSRWMEKEPFRKTIGQEIKKNLSGETCVGFPAILGMNDPIKVKMDLEEKIGVGVFEIPTLPPSIPGIRIFNRFKEWLIRRGVNFVSGYSISKVSLKGKRCEGVYIHHPPVSSFYSADRLILATGRFIGGGLVAGRERISEPIFNLPVSQPGSQEEWFGKSFFDEHPIHRMGILTDSSLRPIDETGEPILENVRVAGTILSGHHCLDEKSREGIEIATGYWAAQRAVAK